MEDNNSDNNQNQSSTGTPVPNPPAQSQQTQEQPHQSQQNIVPNQPSMNPLPGNNLKSSKKNIYIIVSIITAVIIGAVFALLLLTGSSSDARKVSDNFMNAATSNDIDELLKQPGADDDDRSFLESVGENFEGSFELLESTEASSKHYFLYKLTDAKSNYARLTLKEVDGELQVFDIVYGEKELSLIPGEKPEADETEAVSAVPEPSTTKVLACLSQDDYKYMSYDKSVPTASYTTVNEFGSRGSYTANMFFEPDSTTETSLASVYDDWAEFANKNSDKQWTFNLGGGVNDQDGVIEPASRTLAENRTQEVISELTSRGVPTSRIVNTGVLDQSDSYSSDYNTIYRVVRLTIENPCNVDGYQESAPQQGL